MSKQQHSPEKTRKSITLLVGSLIISILLLAVSSWYLLNLERSSNPARLSETTTDSSKNGSFETKSEESPLDIPEGVPEEDAPGTSVPGFVDNFNDGLEPVWTVHYGDPFIAYGQLSSNIGAGIAAGDSSWRDYQIDFDVNTTQIECAFVDTSNSIGVRVTDFDHAYWFVFTNCSAGWSLLAGGTDQGALSLFPDTQVDTLKGKKHITIKAEEKKMSAYENDSLLSSISDSRFATGGVFLQIESQTFYDNFQVTLLP